MRLPGYPARGASDTSTAKDALQVVEMLPFSTNVAYGFVNGTIATRLLQLLSRRTLAASQGRSRSVRLLARFWRRRQAHGDQRKFAASGFKWMEYGTVDVVANTQFHGEYYVAEVCEWRSCA